MTGSFWNLLLTLFKSFVLDADSTTSSTSRGSPKTGRPPRLTGPRSGGSRSPYDPCKQTTKGYNKGMAKRLNVPSSVRNAARKASRSGAAPNVGGIHQARSTALNVGYQAPQKRISWNYKEGDLVRFRDYSGELRFGTVIVTEGSMVEILSPGGMVRMPCQSIGLVERIEENAE